MPPVLTPAPTIYGPGVTHFTQERLVLVEGSDDQAVIAALVEHEGLEGFQIHNMGGKSGWTTRLQAIVVDEGFKDNVRALGLMRDADNDAAACWQSCKAALEAADLVAPAQAGEVAPGDPATCVAIVPSAAGLGAIEEVCLASFPADRMTCVGSYFGCLDGDEEPAQRPSKALVQVYLASLDPLARSLTIAARKRQLNVAHEAFDSLRSFLFGLHGASSG
jgi:hypothetical protein